MSLWTSIFEGLRAVYEVSRSPSSLTTPNSLNTPQAATPCLWMPQHNTISASTFQGNQRSNFDFNVPNSKGVRDTTHVYVPRVFFHAVLESLMSRE